MPSRVKFADNTKNFDGSNPDTVEIYKIIAGLFNVSNFNVKKIGIKQEEVDKLIAKNQIHMMRILASKSTTIVGKDFLKRIRTVSDCLEVCKDKKILNTCINILKLTIEKILEKRETKSESPSPSESDTENDDDEELYLRMIWERKCEANNCYKRLCCLSKKAQSRQIQKKANIISCGSRDYGIGIGIHEYYVTYLENTIKIIENTIKEIEEEEEFLKKIEDEWIIV